MSNPDATSARFGPSKIPPFGSKPKTEWEMLREMLVREALAMQDSGIWWPAQTNHEETIQRA